MEFRGYPYGIVGIDISKYFLSHYVKGQDSLALFFRLIRSGNEFVEINTTETLGEVMEKIK